MTRQSTRSGTKPTEGTGSGVRSGSSSSPTVHNSSPTVHVQESAGSASLPTNTTTNTLIEKYVPKSGASGKK